MALDESPNNATLLFTTLHFYAMKNDYEKVKYFSEQIINSEDPNISALCYAKLHKMREKEKAQAEREKATKLGIGYNKGIEEADEQLRG